MRQHTKGPELIAFLNKLPGFQRWPSWEIERLLNIHGFDYFQPVKSPAEAAAPELLEALQNAVNVMAGIVTGDLKTLQADSPAIAKARAAVAKATGGA